MDIEVSDPAYTDDLADSLRRVGFIACKVGERKVEAHFALPLREEVAGRELDAYLRVWEARHRAPRATRVSP